MRKQKPVSRFATERERYIEAARLVYVRAMPVVDAIKEAGVCIPSYVEVAKQVSWPINEKWSEWYKQESRVAKLLYMAELV